MSQEKEPIIKEWILGSSSKWRQSIFKKEFGSATFAVADIDEKSIRHPQAEMMTQIIAKAKADEILRRGDLLLENCVLVCCDQVIRFRGEVREKPESHEECRSFLQSYMDNPLEFVECINGICTYYNGRFLTHYSISKLTFAGLTNEKIEALIDQGDVMTCAGGFTLCHMEAHELIGTQYGVEGLPVEMVRGLGLLCTQLHTYGSVSDANVFLEELKSRGNVELVNMVKSLELSPHFEDLAIQIEGGDISFSSLPHHDRSTKDTA